MDQLNELRKDMAVVWRSSSPLRFLVEREETGVDGVLYLKLADGRGQDGPEKAIRFHGDTVIQLLLILHESSSLPYLPRFFLDLR